MLILPAIDIKNGNCVRLLQGDPDKETVYSDSPVDMAKEIERQGAHIIHVVDLDGAFEGSTVNFALIKEIASAVSIPIEIGGGIRTKEAVEQYLEAGIKRIILGTVLLDEGFLDSVQEYSENIIAGVDARDSKVATHGWKTVSQIDALVFIQELEARGIKEVIYTDIATDGMLEGPNLQALEHILDNTTEISLIASGGISTYNDIAALKKLVPKGLKGCIFGKAFYDGRIEIEKALEI